MLVKNVFSQCWKDSWHVQPKYTDTIPLMQLLHWGHLTIAGVHKAQHTMCAQGKNSLLASLSLHTLQSLTSFNSLLVCLSSWMSRWSKSSAKSPSMSNFRDNSLALFSASVSSRWATGSSSTLSLAGRKLFSSQQASPVSSSSAQSCSVSSSSSVSLKSCTSLWVVAVDISSHCGDGWDSIFLSSGLEGLGSKSKTWPCTAWEFSTFDCWSEETGDWQEGKGGIFCSWFTFWSKLEAKGTPSSGGPHFFLVNTEEEVWMFGKIFAVMLQAWTSFGESLSTSLHAPVTKWVFWVRPVILTWVTLFVVVLLWASCVWEVFLWFLFPVSKIWSERSKGKDCSGRSEGGPEALLDCCGSPSTTS